MGGLVLLVLVGGGGGGAAAPGGGHDMLLFHLCTGFQNAPNTNTLAATGPSPYSKILYCFAFKCLFQQNSTFDLLLSCGFTPTVYTNLVGLKCLFLQNRFLHGMAWHANANATVSP